MIKFLRFIPVQLTFFLVLGIIVGSYFSVSPQILVAVNVGLLVLLFVTYLYSNKSFQRNTLFSYLVFLISFVIGVTAYTFKNTTNEKHYYSNQINLLESNPQTMKISIRKVLKSSIYHHKYEARIIQLNDEPSKGKLLVNIAHDSTSTNFKVDDEILIKAPLTTINGVNNLYGFDYQKYMRNRQIHHQVYLNSENLQFLGRENRTIQGVAADFRERVIAALKKNGFNDNELGVVSALLLGERSYISKDIMESYAQAGAIHILAVSGLHVGIILLLLTFLFQPLHVVKNGKLIATICIVVLLWSFALIAGFSPSVVRAVAMFTAITIGMQLNRPTNIYNSLVISMFFLLLFNPNFLFEVGFQLSYLAVFAIVWIQPKIYNLWKPSYWMVDKLWQLLTVSLAAQVGVLPLSLYYFHQFPGLFFVSNLFIIPFLGVILVFGIIVIAAALLGVLPIFLAQVYNLVIQTMNRFIEWISSHDFFLIQEISFSFALLLTTYFALFFFFKWTEKRNFQRLVLLGVSIIGIQSVLIFEKKKRQTTQEFIVFNKSRQSVIGERSGELFQVSSSVKDEKGIATILKNYKIGTGVETVKVDSIVQKLYRFNTHEILVVDSLELFEFNSIKPSVVILRQAPKINLDRLLNTLNPEVVIADGSNYKSYVARWKLSCAKKKTPFYNTMQNGAYVLNN